MTSEFAMVVLTTTILAAAPSKKAPAKVQVQDCAKNLQCLVLAAKDCAPAKATHQTFLRLGDTETSATFAYEVKGWDGASKSCRFEKIQTAGSVRFGSEARARIAKQGDNPFDAEKQANQQIAQQLNRPQSCTALPAALIRQIQGWRDGKFGTGDLCTAAVEWEPAKNSKGK